MRRGVISLQARRRRTPSRRSSARRISRCSQTAGIPASEVLQLARTVVQGRLAQAEGDSNEAIERFEQAAALQDALPYTEPPYWYYPVRQSLAAALMQAGRLGEAEEQFRRALVRAPNNGWSYYGLLNSRRRVATPRERKGRKPSWRRPGSAIASNCRYQSSDRRARSITEQVHAAARRADYR